MKITLESNISELEKKFQVCHCSSTLNSFSQDVIYCELEKSFQVRHHTSCFMECWRCPSRATLHDARAFVTRVTLRAARQACRRCTWPQERLPSTGFPACVCEQPAIAGDVCGVAAAFTPQPCVRHLSNRNSNVYVAAGGARGLPAADVRPQRDVPRAHEERRQGRARHRHAHGQAAAPAGAAVLG